jgi:hypothetical protein
MMPFVTMGYLQVNKLRHKDSYGDPSGFAAFLESHQLPLGLIPRYRGNRFHVLFKTCSLFVEHYDLLLGFFKDACCSPTLKETILKIFPSELARTELVALACLGKVLTGPWMTRFYTSSSIEENHMTAVKSIRELVDTMRAITDPMELMQGERDLFGKELTFNFAVFQQFPSDQVLLKQMLGVLVDASVVVLERQYAKYFALDISPELEKEVESARCHNMDAEEIMGMFSAAQQRAPHATLCYLSSRMRAKKNRTVKFLDAMSVDERDNVLKKAMSFGRKQREMRRLSVRELRQEIIKRKADKRQEKDTQVRKAMQRTLEKKGFDALMQLDGVSGDRQVVQDIVSGAVVGRDFCHTWCEDGQEKVYSGSVMKFYKRKGVYTVAYWEEEQSFEDAMDYDLNKLVMAIDYVLGDLMIC